MILIIAANSSKNTNRIKIKNANSMVYKILLGNAFFLNSRRYIDRFGGNFFLIMI
ncbi:hypothetical protein LRLP16767_LR202_00338 [Limosilactobacillus reuteri]|uniref:Uncharacterized protein n=1 Tax=Limosilactobacillus reuteri TaxID=1598 RepID=A0A0U5JUL3_LIMRT|nr:hypothetical protein LRLP16767_LR202_00338 [Limosilactobacillus reuteri]